VTEDAAGRLTAAATEGREPDLRAFQTLTERSPVGVLRALDAAMHVRGSSRKVPRRLARAVDAVLVTLPPEFSTFLSQTRAQRSASLA
jgi:hypothetical protein